MAGVYGGEVRDEVKVLILYSYHSLPEIHAR